MTFAQKLRNNYRCGKCTIVQDKDKDFKIFSTLDNYGNLRYSKWESSIEEAKKSIGCSTGDSDEFINERAEQYSWRIIGTIDFSELGGEGYKEGEKVRILPDAKEKCEKEVAFCTEEKEELIKKGFGIIERKNMGMWFINGWSFPPSALEPFLEEDEKVEEMTVEEICKELGRNIKIIK